MCFYLYFQKSTVALRLRFLVVRSGYHTMQIDLTQLQPRKCKVKWYFFSPLILFRRIIMQGARHLIIFKLLLGCRWYLVYKWILTATTYNM